MNMAVMAVLPLLVMGVNLVFAFFCFVGSTGWNQWLWAVAGLAQAGGIIAIVQMMRTGGL